MDQCGNKSIWHYCWCRSLPGVTVFRDIHLTEKKYFSKTKWNSSQNEWLEHKAIVWLNYYIFRYILYTNTIYYTHTILNNIFFLHIRTWRCNHGVRVHYCSFTQSCWCKNSSEAWLRTAWSTAWVDLQHSPVINSRMIWVSIYRLRVLLLLSDLTEKWLSKSSRNSSPVVVCI